jgi:hypothetical protein
MTSLNLSNATNYLSFMTNTFTPNGGTAGGSSYIIVGIVSTPVPTMTFTQFVFAYDFNGVQMSFIASILPDVSNVYYLVLKMCDSGTLNTTATYTIPNFNLIYI